MDGQPTQTASLFYLKFFSPSMPSLSVDRDLFKKALGAALSNDELEQLTFNFGVELDEVYEENGRTMLKFDIAANRYDLLCQEGLVMALQAYGGTEKYRDLQFVTSDVQVVQFKTHERPFIACAVIYGIKFDQATYDSFINYQTKLHNSIGRNREHVAIGTHDLSKLKGEITYRSCKLNEINFVPLKFLKNEKNEKPVNGEDLEKYFANDKQIAKYFDILTDKTHAVVFEVETVTGKHIMSVPPIINSEYSKISKETSNVFVEVTGCNFNRVNSVLKHLIYNFRGSGVGLVKITQPESNSVVITPVLEKFKYELTAKQINRKLNLNLTKCEIKDLLERMMHTVDIEENKITVSVPDSRSDILHECDILEDIAVAYGFDQFEMKLPEICTVGHEREESKFADKLRTEMALSGYNEVLTLTLLSKYENVIDPEKAVVLMNPKSKEYEVIRTSLLPGVLKAIGANLHGKIPIKVFEVSEVVWLDSSSPEGAKNEKRMCAVIASNKSLLEEVQGPLSLLLEKCGITEYKYKAFSDQRYLENQAATVEVFGEVVGSIGVLHPKICQRFEIPYAASSFELSLDCLFQHFIKFR